MNGLYALLSPSAVKALLRPGFVGGLMSITSAALAAEIQFNTDILDVNDRTNIDLSQFSRSGFILPGVYPMTVQMNAQHLPEQRVEFLPPDDDPKGSAACLTPELLDQFGLKEEKLAQLTWWKTAKCLDLSSLPGLEVSGDLSTSTLHVSLPQAYLQYTAQNWDPPSRWDEGVPGLLVDYNLTAQSIHQDDSDSRMGLSGNGTVGANAGPWRLRADWQGRVDNDSTRRTQNLEWSRFYAYRALPALQARLTVGENYLYSDVFDSFRFTGVALTSDDSQLPPNLRGYAPEVVGVAKTNAKVIISQQGRVLYETLVAAGPFRIQDLNDAVTGSLDVRVEEQDGSVHTFKVDSASIPYLTRPGTVRYKLASGRPSALHGGNEGDFFGTGEFSWGISNGWSLYGGALGDNSYRALSLGLGRDLLAFGAVSLDATRARTQLRDETLSGASYRLSYSKSFAEYDSQITFAGYRFSEKNYMSMSEYLDARHYGGPVGGSKSLYTATFNKQFRDAGVSVFLNYSNQSYWDRPDQKRWNLSLARYFNVGAIKNVSFSLNMFRTQERDQPSSDGVYLSLSLPLGRTGSLSTSANRSQSKNSYSARFSDRLNDRTHYQLSASNTSVGGYLSHTGDLSDVDLTVGLEEDNYTSFSLSARGGATVTANGGALHRSSSMGGTRLMVDTQGVPGVPVRGYGSPTRTNAYGKAVIADISSYYRTGASVDLENLPKNVEATQSVTQLTLTEGAIGYRSLDVIAGEKAMAVLRMPDGKAPPFGATVKNARQQDTGIVNDGGSVYLSGIHPGDQMIVSWGADEQCTLTLPASIPTDGLSSELKLLCQTGTAKNAVAPPPTVGTPDDMEKKNS
ncbi:MULTISPECIES: outer membrane usher protein [Pseudomonas]|uniref:outer membrane usher protein n=1 Tax=Pseudomonas TaxID=286 RepID=UPI000BA23F22|nr:outer membrane usher protein [Pseudomonas lundensis]NLU00204.1 outer membrane usher protein [Pseudomonas lundensis]NNA04794.1 outer membrane usher protein [Pseudomonas lundensis]NNA31407.1 outer membrane usher protein [Pseudomonas lundensis]NNA40485.1 outer membrane usher protein [Pseudomonas lundensis]OZY51351.1 PapC/FimD family outer membrane usher protein [Pseudomonas lundensis]